MALVFLIEILGGCQTLQWRSIQLPELLQPSPTSFNGCSLGDMEHNVSLGDVEHNVAGWKVQDQSGHPQVLPDQTLST